MMKESEIIFIGAGGFFLEVHEYLKYDIENNFIGNIRFKGVLDDDPNVELPENLAYLGKINDYFPEPSDRFIICVGKAELRETIFRELKIKKALFFTYMHSSCYISPTAQIKEGALICPNSIINARAEIGVGVAINVFSSIGHGASVGDYSVLSPYSAVNGDASLGRACFMGTKATINPNVHVGECCIIDSHSYVRKDTESKMIISNKTQYVEIKNRFFR